MTMATTVLQLLPMALGMGEGSELQEPMARVVIGSLASSTAITLILIPVVCNSIERHRERRMEQSALVPQPQAGD